MATIFEQLQKSKKLNSSNVENDLFKFIKLIQNEFIQKEKDRIFNESKDIQGDDLGFYSKATEIITKGRKKAGEPFTGFESGDLFEGLFIKQEGDSIEFGSKSPHLADILKSSGSWLSKDILGLSDEDLKAIIQERLLPFLLQNIKNTLNV